MSMPACLPACQNTANYKIKIKAIFFYFLFFVGLIFSNVTFAQWINWSGCRDYNSVRTSNIYFYVNLNIQPNAQSKDFMTNWISNYDPYSVPYCFGPSPTPGTINLGADFKIHPEISVPNTTVRAPGNMTVVDQGITYPVLTTPALQDVGLGYILRWKLRLRTAYNT